MIKTQIPNCLPYISCSVLAPYPTRSPFLKVQKILGNILLLPLSWHFGPPCSSVPTGILNIHLMCNNIGHPVKPITGESADRTETAATYWKHFVPQQGRSLNTATCFQTSASQRLQGSSADELLCLVLWRRKSLKIFPQNQHFYTFIKLLLLMRSADLYPGFWA